MAYKMAENDYFEALLKKDLLLLNHQLPYALFNLLHFYGFMNYSHSVSVKPQQPHSTIQTETAMMILRSINGYIQARVIGLSFHTVCIFYGNTYLFLRK